MKRTASALVAAIGALPPSGALALGAMGCGDGSDVRPSQEDVTSLSGSPRTTGQGTAAPEQSAPCDLPAQGCSCDVDGGAVLCVGLEIRTGNYISCSLGTRTCDQGVWGRCVGKTVYQSPMR